MSRDRIEAVESDSLARRNIGPPRSRTDPHFNKVPTIQAGLLRQLQREAGNHAVSGLLGRSNVNLQRAGDPEGLMLEHPTDPTVGKFTYHHIIPENKLVDLWKAFSANQHLSQVQGGLTSVTNRGLAQFDSAALINITSDLNREIGEVTKAWDTSKFEEVVTAGTLGGTSAELIERFFPGLKEDPQLGGSYQPLKTIFDKRFKMFAETSKSNITESVEATGTGYLADDKAKAGVEHLLMWMPGNIHQGPSARFTPGDAGFDAALDDGGSKFERAAQKIINPTQFATVSALNTAIDEYLAAKDEPKAVKVSSLLDEMKGYSVTAYDPAQWEKVTLGGKKKKTAWRFK